MTDQTKAGRQGLPTTTRGVQMPHTNPRDARQASREGETLSTSSNYAPCCPVQTQHESEHAKTHSISANDDERSTYCPHSLDIMPTSVMDRDMTLELAKAIASGSLSAASLKSFDLRPLSTIRRQPPVTEASLSELDISRIRSDPKLRHDLNFDRDVSFRPNYDGEKGRQKKELAKQYWAVLAVEFALYMQAAIKRDSGILKTSYVATRMTWRLSQMFISIRDILKTLIREEDSESIEQMLDVDLLMQQLKNGICDLISLGDWLGTVIKSSCSPVRDAFVGSVVKQIRDSVTSNDPCALSVAIEHLFSILEIMKLDVANHQIRGLRLLMIGQTVQFSQHYFLNYCQTHPSFDYDSANHWYQACRSAYLRHSQNKDSPLSNLQIFGRATVDLLANYWQIPHTFAFDHDRLVGYQATFQVHRAREAVVQTFARMRHNTGSDKSTTSTAVVEDLMQRITQLDPSFSFMFSTFQSPEPTDDIVIEILRATYKSTGRPDAVPTAEDFDLALADLSMRLNVDFTVGADVQNTVRRRLQNYVEQEVSQMQSMDELRMLEYCEHAAKQENGVLGAGVEMASGRYWLHRSHSLPDVASEVKDDTLKALAAKVAHVAVLHWRVWSPLLYERHPADWRECDVHGANQMFEASVDEAMSAGCGADCGDETGSSDHEMGSTEDTSTEKSYGRFF